MSVQAQSVDYQMVTVGEAGNAASIYGYGDVGWDFQIGKYEVTIQHYTDFLNAVASVEDPYDLYDSRMGTDLNVAGILRTTLSGGYSYSVIDNHGNSANRPITYVSWFDAARFANWMSNGQPVDSASTETGAYTLDGILTGAAPTKNTINQNTGAAPTFYIPSENEWYKAAYYSADYNGTGLPGYYLYATQSNDTPGNAIGSAPNQVNYIEQPPGYFSVTQEPDLSSAENYLSDVGAFSSSAGYFGTFDQNGNVWEITDTPFGVNRALLVVRGGGWTSYDNYIWNSYRLSSLSESENSNGGFRLAAPVAVPEPAAGFLVLAGLGVVLWRMKARRSAVAMSLAVAFSVSAWAGPVSYNLVTIGDPGNEADDIDYGRVDHVYSMGVYDVTIQQYTDFLNIVAAESDPYGLYNSAMGTDLNVAGIERIAQSGGYYYSVIENQGSSANRPITYVSWFDAARFANWMSNGQSADAGSTENGAYNLTTTAAQSGIAPVRNLINPNTNEAPTFFIPTRDEWYKAAFYSLDYNDSGSPGYYNYATQHDGPPSNSDPDGTNQANIYRGAFTTTGSNIYSEDVNYLTDVGFFGNSPSYFGTYDQNGNVYQWNDLDGIANASRGLDGGFWFGGPTSAANTTLSNQTALYEGNDAGFRLAGSGSEDFARFTAVPEPEAWQLLVVALLGFAACRWRRVRG